MRSKLFWAILIIALCQCFPVVSSAEMASDSYRILSSVNSAGGGSFGSMNYQINSTIGQPSPLMGPLAPPFSDTYDLYPGFWYTIAVSGVTCSGDFNGDGDVDGKDLAEFIFDSGGLGVDVFAANFGKENCL